MADILGEDNAIPTANQKAIVKKSENKAKI
jgi:hypothetical protein